MSARSTGREGASLVEVVVAAMLLGLGVLIWLGAFNRAVFLLADAHLGLHAAILLSEASREPPAGVPGHPVGPGHIEVVEGSLPLSVRYAPHPGAQESGLGPYGEPRTWSLTP